MARIKHGTLEADTVTEVALDGDAQKVEVLNRDGADEIYFLIDSGDTDPEVEGDDCDVLVAAMNNAVKRSRATGSTKVKMVSPGTPKYTVRVADDD